MVLLKGIDDSEAWAELELYRQRYEIEARLEPIRRLQRALARREATRAEALRQIAVLERELAATRRKLDAVETEIQGTETFATFLIGEILDRVRSEHGEAWTPFPILGYRMWRIEKNTLHGSQMPWSSPTYIARCLRRVPGDDVPHSEATCGPPACGVYITKELESLTGTSSSRFSDDHVVGVVALTGKVVEHARGYRGARASVVAISAQRQGYWFHTAKADDIKRLFTDPERTIASMGQMGVPSDPETQQFLRYRKDKEAQWT